MSAVRTQFKKRTPGWIVACAEQMLVSAAFLLAVGVLGSQVMALPVTVALGVNLLIGSLLAFCFKTYSGDLRFSGVRDISRIARFSFCQLLIWLVVSRRGGFPVVNAAFSFALLVGFRLLIKGTYTRVTGRYDKSFKNMMFRVNELTQLTIGSLIDRDEPDFRNEETGLCFYKGVVMVSGAAGSIGSEICRQLLQHGIRRIILLDQSESELFNLEFELRNRKEGVEIDLEVASVRDRQRIEEVFARYKPDYVFHAAAYKHVPMMETMPSEAILTNVLGTQVLADAAVRYHVQKFIMVSTDKAVNPTNVMGATKSIAEIYIQSLAKRTTGTRFITTRFGNVLGSNGSIVPLFIRQILRGGPVTITHPEVTRYFMTIPEAGRLVVEACVMGRGGEIFVFNMGKPVKIVEIALKLIGMAGYTEGKDIHIEYIGLRPGEKIHEELFNASEDLMPTYHPTIMAARTRDVDTALFNTQMGMLIEHAVQHRQMQARTLMHAMLPEFKQ